MTEALYLARQSSLAEEKNRLNETPMLYSCSLCGKGYRSSKALGQHLKSRSHILRASQRASHQDEETTIIKPLTHRTANKPPPQREPVNEESEDEWEEVNPDEDLVGEATESITQMNVNEHASNDDMDESDDDDDFEIKLDPTCCFMCDQEQNTIERCIVHTHKQHGFFIPDVEYLKDPKGLLTYLGLKVTSYKLVLHFFPSFVFSISQFWASYPFKTSIQMLFKLSVFSIIFQVTRDFMCLYCNDGCHPFNSLEAVRKHMVAKSHCKVHYGDGGDDEEAELEEFYDYSSRSDPAQ